MPSKETHLVFLYPTPRGVPIVGVIAAHDVRVLDSGDISYRVRDSLLVRKRDTFGRAAVRPIYSREELLADTPAFFAGLYTVEKGRPWARIHALILSFYHNGFSAERVAELVQENVEDETRRNHLLKMVSAIYQREEGFPPANRRQHGVA